MPLLSENVLDTDQPVRHQESSSDVPSANLEKGLTRAELRRRRAAEADAAIRYSDDSTSSAVTAAVAVASVVAAVAATDGVVPVADVPSVVEAPSDAQADSAQFDDFIAASRLFAFTAESAAPSSSAFVAPAEEAKAETCKVKRRGLRDRLPVRRMLATSFSVGVMGIVGLLAVGMTTPVTAVAAAPLPDVTTNPVAALAVGDVRSIDDNEIQAYVAPADAAGVDLGRTGDVYETAKVAAVPEAYGITTPSSDFFANDINSDIQWPFAVGVGITYGFGMRSGTMHEGIDFTPGEGAAIQAIAAGTVRIATEAGGGYGVMVIIDHVIDGQLISSRYGHMQYGSLQVATGDVVEVGTIVGRTGNTGRSFGAHLHLEILLGGTTAIDPMPWLQTHVK